jgi:hypothetical protein
MGRNSSNDKGGERMSLALTGQRDALSLSFE